MTIVITSIAPKLIVMTVDAAVIKDFETHREYTTGRKCYCFPGVGCVATWGERTGNKIGLFLDSQNIRSGTHSIEDLRDLVWKYLTEDYTPKEDNRGDVGFHVAGFDSNNRARFFEMAYAPESRREDSSGEKYYQKHDSSPEANSLRFSYGGRFNLAHTIVNIFFQEVRANRDIRYDYLKPDGLIKLNDFVARLSSELTKEVGPPFITYLVASENKIERLQNTAFCPIEDQQITEKLKNLGFILPTPIADFGVNQDNL